MIKKILLPILLLCAFSVNAQFNNSWIDYTKSYYKFKLNSDNITRIPQSTLAAAGLVSVNADNFQLWRNGKEVRLFTSASGTVLGTNDFIEFWGEMNDGKADAALYKSPQFQLADRFSLETDTSTYFLTVNTSGSNLRYTTAVNASPSAATPDAFFMRKIDLYYKNNLNRGFARDLGEYVYSSAYDNGEGYTTTDRSVGAPFTETISGLNVYTAGPANSLSVRAKVFSNTDNIQRTLTLRLFGNTISSTVTSNTSQAIFNATNQPLTFLQNTATADVSITNSNISNPAITDRFVVATVGITYPSLFNFNNSKSFSFELAASTGNNIVIDNFNYGTTAPVLYDVNNGRRYIGDIASTPGKVKFVLPASADVERKFILNNVEAASIVSVNNLTAKTFTNYNTTTTRGDYIIISNPILYNDGAGVNNVELYRAYRSTANGGGYNAKVYDINELTDQFGFGIKSHPDAIRNFVRFMDVQYPVKPKFIFIIGRGVTYQGKRPQEANPTAAKLDLVGTFGWPASDNLLVSQPASTFPITPVGRLGAISGREVGYYYQKVLQYEQAQRTQSPLIADKGWMKNMIHAVGGKNDGESLQLGGYMDECKVIAQDTLYGANVETFRKTSVATVQQASSERITQLFEGGMGFIGYFGHSSATVFEFNISNPENYNNVGKYPFFNVSGCIAGDFFSFDPARLSVLNTLSERYTFADQRGSIGFLADTHFGVGFYLNQFNTRFYQNFSKRMYGQSVGQQLREVQSFLDGANPSVDYLMRIHLEEVNLNGDPAIKINAFPKPDYVIEEPSVVISPNIITVADPFFNVKVNMRNIGKASGDSIRVSVKRLFPNATVPVMIKDTLIPGIKFADSLNLNIPIEPAISSGLNKIIVELDWTNLVSEIYETNNKITKDVFIFENTLSPVFPYNYGIVNTQNITFSASTANPLVGQSNFAMEIDTTELFNSAFKKTYNVNSVGGLIQFTPTNLIFTDSTVYYWRTAVVPTTGVTIWNNASFVYLPNGGQGFNQSHYFQFLKSNYDANIFLSNTRNLKFTSLNTFLNVSTGNFPPNDFPETTISLGAFTISNWGTRFNTFQFTVLDGTTGSVIKNTTGGLYGSNSSNRLNQFEFFFGDVISRTKIVDFLNLMPNNAVIIMYPLLFNGSVNSYVNQWQTDPTITTAPNLYDKLKGYGFTMLDSFYRNRAMNFKFSKDGSTPSFQKVGGIPEEIITAQIPITLTNVNGVITSPIFGPAKSWDKFQWQGNSLDTPNRDSITFQLIGITSSGAETVLYTIDSTIKDLNITGVNATIYPFIKVKFNNIDSSKGTPYQLRYIRLKYTPVPEGAVAPNIRFTMKDSVDAGDPIAFSLAFKNISQVRFDSLMRINLRIKTANNFDSIINIPRGKILIAGDTLVASYSIPSEKYPGKNTLFIEFNPINNPPEQFHFNNILYKDFFVKSDVFNPLLDVTFDGVHILSRDIVAAKPVILIKLKDENRFLALRDTALIKVQLRYPDQTLRSFSFGDTLRFNPANLSTGENAATIEFKPFLPQDGEYELIVSGRDVSGNKVGALNYRTAFTVINKPMISELLNFPNPFTTSTAFVFTLTGSQIPQNMRIQILTITGKVVKEITKEELGAIHIGRNITDYKWDGTDMYGQKLANGVYIYRVITNLNGKSFEKYKAEGDDINKFFNKGYGKMYLMR